MLDVKSLIEGFAELKKKTLAVGTRQNTLDATSRFLGNGNNLSDIIDGNTNPPYNGRRLVHDLVKLAVEELDRNATKTFKRDAFDIAAKFIPKIILADSIDAEDAVVIQWYHRICGSSFADKFVDPVLPCILAFFTTVTPTEIPGNHVAEMWRSLWSHVASLHFVEHYNAKYLANLLDCLGAILKIAKQTVLVDQPWNTVRSVFDGLGLHKEDTKIWQRSRLSSFPELLQLLRLLLHQWGFTYRVQIVAALQPMMKSIASSLEFDKYMAQWGLPWTEINKNSSAMEHAWLLLEEYGSLVGPKECPIHIPSGTPPSELALFELADLLVVKYAKCCISSHFPTPSPAVCRLVARALVVQHRLQRTGSFDDSSAAAAAGGGAGCSTQLASFTKMKLASQFSSQLGSQLSSQTNTQRSQFTSTQKIVNSRKRRMKVKMLQTMASLDFSTSHSACAAHVNLDETPTDWKKFVIECMTQVYDGHMKDLGEDAADLVRMTIASAKKISSEELIPSIARLLCTVMEKKANGEIGAALDSSLSRRLKRRYSNGDGAAISELWFRAHSWTHIPTVFDTATRLLIECDRWLLSHEETSMLQPELRWTKMIEVLKPAPLSSAASVDLLQHCLASYEFDEKERLKKYEENYTKKDWPFRRELIDWLMSRDVNLDISSAVVSVCSYYPKRKIVNPVDRRSSPWMNQECRMRALVRTQFDGDACDADRDTRPDTLIKEMIDVVVEAVGRGPADNLIELRRLCVLQRLTTRMKRAKIGVDELTQAGGSADIINESIMSVRREMELEGMERLAERRWESCQWLENFGINAVDTESLLRFLQHEEILDGLPDMIFSTLVYRRDNESDAKDKERLTALTAVMRQFMMDHPEPEKLLSAIESIAACSSLHLVDHKMRRMGDVTEKLAEAVEDIIDVQTMIYKYGHMVLPESRARLIDKMSRLVDEEKEEEVSGSYAHHMEEMIIAHYAMEIRLEYAINIDLDRSDVVERVLTQECLVSRLELESDRGEMTGECEELVKACLSPGRWKDHHDTVRTVGRFTELMKRCLSTQPLLCSIMDEMAAAIDIDTVIKQEMDMDDEYSTDQHKDYIDMENLWSPIQREISRVCTGLRAKSNEEEQFSCSMADSSLPTALLLPHDDWKIMKREWNGTMQSHALKILVEYGKRCKEIGLELRFIEIVGFLIGQKFMETSPYRFMLEALAEEAVWSVHSRCSVRSTDFIRASTSWSRIRGRLRPLVSPSHFRLRTVVREQRQRTFGDDDFDAEFLSPLISTPDWWKHATETLEEHEREAARGDSSSLLAFNSRLIDAYRTVHEARCVPDTATTVLPKIAARGVITRNSFDMSSFYAWLRLHIELWWYGRRFTENTPEEIQVIMDAYEEAPLGKRTSGETSMQPARRVETDLLARLLRLAYNTSKSADLKTLLARLNTVLPALNLHYECLPFIVSLCPAEEAIDNVLMSSPELLQERDEENEMIERRGKRREGREGKRVGDVAILIEECLTVVGIAAFSRVCVQNDRDSEQPLADMAKLAIDSGVMSLARICIDLAAESSLPNRSFFLFDPSFTLPDCLEDTRKAAVIATRDAVTARSLSSSTQAQNEIRRILAESRFDWHLSSSSEARAAVDEEDENYLLRFTQWTSFSKKLATSDRSLNGALVLMQKDEEASQRIVERLRSSISSRLCSTRDLLSSEVRKDVRCTELLRIFGEEKENERFLSPSLTPVSSSPFSTSTSHLDEECLLRVGVALAKWSRRREEGEERRAETAWRESFSVSSGTEFTHQRVEEAVRHLERIRAYKPALRLLSQWSSISDSSRIRARVALDEARIRVQMGEEYVGLHAIEEIRKEGQGDDRILVRASFLESDIVLEHTKNREKSRRIVKEAISHISARPDSYHDSSEDSRLLHEAHTRIFHQTSKILEETQTIMESRGFTMKREAIGTWKKQLEEIRMRNQESEKKTKIRLEREVACETEEIARMESRMDELAIECIVAGLDALKSSPNTKPDTSAEILFPLLDILFKYGQTDKVATIIKDHIVHSECLYFVQGVGHIVGHVFKETPITKPLRVLLAKLVMLYPFHVLPRLLFYYDAGGDEEANIRNIIEQVTKKRPGLKEDVEKIEKAHFLFRDFTQADVNVRSLFTAGLVNGKKCIKMSDRVSLLRDQAALRLVPIPTVHLEAGQSIDTVPHITNVCDIFFQADGLSVPKVLTVRTSDGLERRIICKKEDVRQDAMVEHLFEAINTILQQANGGRNHQEMRTYKVVPLDINNGLIEFCGGTISLKELLCGMDRMSGLHKEIYPDDITAKDALSIMGNAPHNEKVQAFRSVCQRLKPVFRHYFYKEYSSPREWSDKLDAYRRSLAQWSIVCYVVGLGDRHSSNVLFEPATAKFVHIDLGMILEYSKRSLPVPERVPFRLTRDLVDPLIGDALDGHFTSIAVDTIVALRKKSSVLLGIASALLRETMSNFEEATPSKDSSLISKTAICRLRDKLAGTDAGFAPQTPNEQVRRLIGEATDIQNLATIFHGWMPFL